MPRTYEAKSRWIVMRWDHDAESWKYVDYSSDYSDAEKIAKQCCVERDTPVVVTMGYMCLGRED